jgi:amidohydrolase
MPASLDRLQTDIDEIMPGVVADRRHLHMHPEVGYQEVKTAAFIVDRLRSLGIDEIRTGVGKTGVVALIRGAQPGFGKVVALRADMDALPILEENEVDYASTTPGTMHACGHDAHVSILLATARMLVAHRDDFAGTVKLLFQPAEEGGGGASAMIADGALDDPFPDAVFGLHIWQHTDVGLIEARVGGAMLGADGFKITIHGQGGHGAQPHLCVDPIVVAAQIVTALQTLVARETDPIQPAVVTVGAFHAGDAANVIPDVAELRGSIRFIDEAQRVALHDRMTALVEGIATAMRATADISFRWGVGPTVNDPAMTEIVRAAAAEVVGAEHVRDGEIRAVSEDMSEFLNRVPGCYFFLGSRNVERGLSWGHHTAKFDIDESAMALGVETMTRTALRFLTA